MGKGGSSAEMEVNKYFLSQHFGICAGADVLLSITIKEKLAWSGSVTTQSEFVIDYPSLFGSSSKEGGVEGVVHYLPGADDQLLSDVLAQKLGRPSGADCPGFRGLASLFFTGPAGTANAGYGGWGDQTRGKRGFYWTANNPYLPGVWAEVRRAPVGLNPAYAMVPADITVPAGIEALDLSWRLPCGVLDGAYCVCPASDSDSFTFPGAPTSTYDVEFRVRGVVELISYSGGSVQGPSYFYKDATGGNPSLVNRYKLVVSDPPATYFFNNGGFSTSSLTAVDYTVTIPIQGGATIELIADSVDGGQVRNAASVVATDDDPAQPLVVSQPYNGQFLQLNAIFSTASGSLDANPAHLIYECLTNTDWGMGSPATTIDTDSFEAAAVTLYNEAFGLSMIWTRQASIQDFVQEVLDHVQAVLFVDPATGLMTLKLIRGDYDADTLDEINPSNADLSSFGRKLWGEIVNEVVVTWTNPENEQEETVTVQDLASIVTQGGIVSDGRNYYGVRNAALAQRLAQRDLRSAGAPLASCEAEVDRTLWQVRPASVYRLVWPEYGLNGVVMRVSDVNYGRPGDPTIKLTLVEDVFGLDVGDYVSPPGTIWADPSSAPAPLDHVQILTLPYFLAARTAVAAYVDSPAYPEVVAGVLGNTADDDTFNFELWDEVSQADGSLVWQSLQTENVIGRAELATPFEAEAETTFDLSTDLTSVLGQTSPTQGGFMMIGDGTEAENEIALVTAVGSTVTVSRGVLDTVPRSWPTGTPVWFVDGSTLYEDPLVRAASEVVSYRMLTRTSQGLLTLAEAPEVSHTMTERPWLPSRPANVQVDGALFNAADDPVDTTGRADPWITIEWANRNRLMEDSQVLGWTEATVMPEDGQTTTVTVYDSDGVTQLAEHGGLTGTSFDVPDASFGSADLVLIVTTAERVDPDGTFDSLQGHGIWVMVGVPNLQLSGDMSDGEDVLLLSGDMTDGNDRLELSGTP